LGKLKTVLICCLLLSASAPALAFNKCQIKGKTVYQDAPCPKQVETIQQQQKRAAKYEAYYQELFELVKKDVGAIVHIKAPVKEGEDSRRTRPGESHRAASIRNNAASAASIERTMRLNCTISLTYGPIEFILWIVLSLS